MGSDNRAHSYEVTEIELLDSSSEEPSGKADNPFTPMIASNNSISVTRLLRGVEKTYDKGKTLLSESKGSTSGEPTPSNEGKVLWNRFGSDSGISPTLAQGGSDVHNTLGAVIQGSSSRETLTTPLPNHEADGVTLPSNELSTSKDSTSGEPTQVRGGEIRWRGGKSAENEQKRTEDEEYMQAVESGDMEKAQRMVMDKADRELRDDMRLASDEGVMGFQYHRGPAPKKTRTMYAVFNVTPEGFKAAYAGNKTGTPVGVWLDAMPLKSWANDKNKNDDGSPSRYVAGDTGASWNTLFTPETYERMMQEDPTITKSTK